MRAVARIAKGGVEVETLLESKTGRGTSGLEIELALMLQAEGLPQPVREYRFDAVRHWRFDFAWPDRMLAVEVEGGTWCAGRHTRGLGYEADLEKYNAAALSGWMVLRFSGGQVRDGCAIRVIAQALGERAT